MIINVTYYKSTHAWQRSIDLPSQDAPGCPKWNGSLLSPLSHNACWWGQWPQVLRKGQAHFQPEYDLWRVGFHGHAFVEQKVLNLDEFGNLIIWYHLVVGEPPLSHQLEGVWDGGGNLKDRLPKHFTLGRANIGSKGSDWNSSVSRTFVSPTFFTFRICSQNPRTQRWIDALTNSPAEKRRTSAALGILISSTRYLPGGHSTAGCGDGTKWHQISS